MFLIRVIFFFKQKTAYEMRISDWSSDVCSSDLIRWIVDQRLQRCFPIRINARDEAFCLKRNGYRSQDILVVIYQGNCCSHYKVRLPTPGLLSAGVNHAPPRCNNPTFLSKRFDARYFSRYARAQANPDVRRSEEH